MFYSFDCEDAYEINDGYPKDVASGGAGFNDIVMSKLVTCHKMNDLDDMTITTGPRKLLLH